MHRLACVSLPAFPLQLLLRRHPEWKDHPVVVVAEDKPQAEIVWVNARAQAARILPGQRYAYALSLARDLRAGVIGDSEIIRAVEKITELLRNFTPFVEPYPAEPGVFWLDGSGLDRLYASPHKWSQAIYRAIRSRKFCAVVVTGFSRFGSYALARARAEHEGTLVLDSAAAEAEQTKQVPLWALGALPALREEMSRLGIATLQGFLRLPPAGLAERFGAQAVRLHELARGERWDPLQPDIPKDPFEREVCFDDPEKDSSRLVFALRRALDDLLARLAKDKLALSGLFLEFQLDRQPQKLLHCIRPAAPTLDSRILLRLVHVRLEHFAPPAGVVAVKLIAEEIAATREQLQLFATRPRRDLRAANEAFAGLRAEFGNDCVVKAVMRDGHLPEARFAWEALRQAETPRPLPASTTRPVVRRMLARPQALPGGHGDPRNDGWLLSGLERGPVTELCGSFSLTGGWWQTEVQREYHYAETQDGHCLWVYYDRRRRRWFLQGQVE